MDKDQGKQASNLVIYLGLMAMTVRQHESQYPEKDGSKKLEWQEDKTASKR
jgi:hypothetical protein